LITNGGKQAIANAFLTLLDPGDEVIVPAPYWVTFPEAIALAGGIPMPISTTVDGGFRVTLEQWKRPARPVRKAILFVSPSNPTGAMYSREEVEAIGRFAVDRGCGSSRTRCTSTSSTATGKRHRCRWSSPNWPTAAW